MPGWWSILAAGASPLFPPAGLSNAQAKEALVETLHQDPHTFAQARSRWTLGSLQSACPFLAGISPSGFFRCLKRFRIHYKRARAHLFSPDPDYRAKLAAIRRVIDKCQQNPTRFVVLFLDEMSLYRQPTLAQAWEQSGPIQPLAELGYSKNAWVRIAGALNALTGQVTTLTRVRMRVSSLVRLFQEIRAAYPKAEAIYVVADNWPLHFHADVLAALQPQTFAFALHQPGNWPTAPSVHATRLNLPIQLLPLPTYAPWTNPIEKLWRLLRQTLGHLHRYGDHWQAFKQEVQAFLDQFASGSTDLLRYVGLSDLDRLYQRALAPPEGV